MTKQEKLIREIKTDFDKEKNTKSYERVKRMAKTLSNNLYSEDSHFIYELIQNAQDNEYASDTVPSLDFYIFEDGILTKNNEIGFLEVNIKALCDFNDSPKSKNKALGFIGEKGIGFKSVFAITDTPSIHSNGYRFYFKDGEYIEPYWIESFENFPLEFQDKNSTNIYLPYSPKFNNQTDIEEKLDDIEPILILFLNKLKQIKIYKNLNLQFSVIKKYLPNHVVSIENNNENLEFKIFSKVIDCIETIKEEKRENVLKRELYLAFPLQPISDTRIFAFLPTEIETGLPFLIQADFLLNASRSEIERNKEWNKWILDEIVTFFAEIFHQLQNVDKYNYLRYLLAEESTNKFINTYYQQILQKLQDKKLFLTIEEQYEKSSNIAILNDFDFMYKYLKEIGYLDKSQEKFSFLHKDFFIPKHIENNWKLTKIDKKEFLRIIGNLNKYFAPKFETDNLLFEELLDYIGNNYKDKDILNNLPIIPIDEDEKIKFYSKTELEHYQIFFKLDEDGLLNNVFQDLKIVSKKYRDKLEKIDFFSSILEIKQPNLMDILSSLNDDFFGNIENNVNFLVYIKNNYKQNDDDIVNLIAKKYIFLSKTNSLVKHEYAENHRWNNFSTKLYISKEYLMNDNSMEQIVEKYCNDTGKQNVSFISSLYFEKDKQTLTKKEDELKKEWIDFFAELKINDEIKFEIFSLKMWNYDSKYEKRETTKKVYNIPFLTTPIFDEFDNNKLYETHLNLNNLTREDSIFLFKKLLTLEVQENYYLDNELFYNRVKGFYRDFECEKTKTPWKSLIESNFPIYLNDTKFKIKDFYLNVEEKLIKFFKKFPSEYQIQEYQKENAKKIFNIQDKPIYSDVLNLIKAQKIDNFEDIKSIFEYLHYNFKDKKLDLNVVPVFQQEKIDYISKEKLIWEDGKELGLIEIKPFYMDDFKRFFIDQIGIAEKPTIEQFVNVLKAKPKNHKNLFYKFISLLSKEIKKYEHIRKERIILINDKLYSCDDIIFNDEFLDNYEYIENLLTIDKKYYSHFKNIIDTFDIRLLSSFDREYILSNKTDDIKLIDIYLKLLNFAWDYTYSKDNKKFEDIKTDKDFILETKSILYSAYANIILRLDVYGQNLDINKNLAIQNDTLYLSAGVDEKNIIKEIAKYISEKVQKISFETLERFYDKVYKYNEFNKEDYYKDEEIRSPEKDEDKFDIIFENIKNNGANFNENTENYDEKFSDKSKSEKNEPDGRENDNKASSIGNHNNSFSQNSHTEPNSQKKKIEESNSESQKQNTITCPICGFIQCDDTLQVHLCKVHSYKCEEQNKKTICPECKVELNSNNLKKHLCKVHQKNCDENNENHKNYQNIVQPQMPNVKEAINQHNKNVPKTEQDINPAIVTNVDEYKKTAEKQLKESLTNSNENTRFRHAKSKIKVGEKDTKEFLKQEYRGHCQICGFTFDKKDSQGKYFERFTWLSEKITKQKNNLIEAGSSLCLCSKCHSILKYGDFESKFVKNLEQTSTKISDFSFDQFCDVITKNAKELDIPDCYDFIEMYKLPIRILNEDKAIFYTEEHLLLFYTMLVIGECI